MRSIWNFYSAGQLTFGEGAAGHLAEICARRRWQRVFMVTDATLADLGVVDQVRGPLQKAGVVTSAFTGGQAEPAISVAVAAAEQARAERPDVVLGLGGGSNMDLAKLVAVLIQHGGRPADYFGFDRVPGPVTPLIAVPTTAGTGSEVSHAAVLTDSENQIKVSTLSNWLRPTVAVVDPKLTMSCPPRVTGDSGIDALTHAIEAVTATDYDQLRVPDGEQSAYEGRFVLSDCLAERAIELIGQHLVTAYEHPADREARRGMALAATLAGLAFSNSGVALVHALEYPIGGVLHCSHGLGNGLLLPYVMRFNLDARRATLARVAKLLGKETVGMSQEEAAESAIEAVIGLRQRIGIPHQLRELGGTADQLPMFAKKAFAIERLRWINPRASSEDDLLQILKDAW